MNNENKANEQSALNDEKINSGKSENAAEVVSIPKVSKIIFDEEKGAVTLVLAKEQ